MFTSFTYLVYSFTASLPWYIVSRFQSDIFIFRKHWPNKNSLHVRSTPCGKSKNVLSQT